MKLKGKIAVITGASRGIGKAVAQLFCQNGAALMLSARSTDELTKAKTELQKEGGNVEVCSADVSRKNDVNTLVRKAVDIFGSIDVLVNAAGVYGSIGPVTGVDFEKWKKTFDTNLFGMFSVIQEA